MSRFAVLPGLRTFARAERGAMAVEFALIALPFMVLLFGIVELAMVLLASSTLQSATEAAARTIRTGDVQTTGVTKDAFKDRVCANMDWLSAGCGAKMTVAVQTYTDFATASGSSPAKSSTFDPTKPTCWSPGQPGDIVLVRTYYQWDLFTPMLDHALANMQGSTTKRLLTSVSAFRNEPFSSTNKVGAGC